MMTTHRFLYLDLDSFYCCCEILRDPSLRKVSFAVGGSPAQRGVVSSASYPARRYGVRSAMPMSQAVRLCPGLRVIPPHFDDYQRRSQEVMEYVRTLTNAVEQRSVDEGVLDISDLAQDSATIAQEIQATIRQRFRLPCSLGIAGAIRVAKVAVEYGKKQGTPGRVPQAIMIVPPGAEATFLAPLPVGIMPGIGPKLEASLRLAGIATLGALASWPMRDLQRRYGRYGLQIQRAAQGIDQSEIETSHQRKAISHEHTFPVDVVDRATLLDMLARQSNKICATVQAKGQFASVVKIKVRWEDFTTLTRQMTLAEPTNAAAVITQAAYSLFAQVWKSARPVRLIGVGISGLQSTRQLRLWDMLEIAGVEPPAMLYSPDTGTHWGETSQLV
jgi:DNA polymerase IV